MSRALEVSDAALVLMAVLAPMVVLGVILAVRGYSLHVRLWRPRRGRDKSGP